MKNKFSIFSAVFLSVVVSSTGWAQGTPGSSYRKPAVDATCDVDMTIFDFFVVLLGAQDINGDGIIHVGIKKNVRITEALPVALGIPRDNMMISGVAGSEAVIENFASGAGVFRVQGRNGIRLENLILRSRGQNVLDVRNSSIHSLSNVRLETLGNIENSVGLSTVSVTIGTIERCVFKCKDHGFSLTDSSLQRMKDCTIQTSGMYGLALYVGPFSHVGAIENLVVRSNGTGVYLIESSVDSIDGLNCTAKFSAVTLANSQVGVLRDMHLEFDGNSDALVIFDGRITQLRDFTIRRTSSGSIGYGIKVGYSGGVSPAIIDVLADGTIEAGPANCLYVGPTGYIGSIENVSCY